MEAERGQAGAAGVELPKQKNISSGQLELEQKIKLVSGVCIGMLCNMLYTMPTYYITRVKKLIKIVLYEKTVI